MSNPVNDILKLSVEEKVSAVEKIWNSIDNNSLPASEEEIKIARERYNEYLKNPEDLISWEKARKGLMKKYGF